MFNSVKFKYDYTIIISPWLIISIVTWPMLIDNMSNAAILTSVLFLCDTIRYINKEIKITIADFKIVTTRDIHFFKEYVIVFLFCILNPLLNKSSLWMFFLAPNIYSPFRLYMSSNIFLCSFVLYLVSVSINIMKKKWLTSLNDTVGALMKTEIINDC